MISQCRQFAEQVIPELRGSTYYILDSDALQNDPGLTRDEVAGWAAPASAVTAVLPQYLGDEWIGPGPAIFLNQRWIRNHAFPGHYERAVLSVFTHELGHWDFPLTTPAPCPPSVTEPLGRWQLSHANYCLDPANIKKPADDEGHDWKWIRRTCHLYVRAAFHGYSLPHLRLLHSGYCEFAAQEYLPQLLEEALRMRDEPMAAINELPLLDWLVEQYHDDVERMMAEIAAEEVEPCGVA